MSQECLSFANETRGRSGEERRIEAAKRRKRFDTAVAAAVKWRRQAFPLLVNDCYVVEAGKCRMGCEFSVHGPRFAGTVWTLPS